MTPPARATHLIRSAGNAGRVGYAKTKTIAIAIAALCCAVWLGGCKDSTPTADEAAAPQAEAATSTAPAAPVNPLLAMAQVEPGADGQPPRLTLYGLTLDAPLPDYPACTDDMLWQRNATRRARVFSRMSAVASSGRCLIWSVNWAGCFTPKG